MGEVGLVASDFGRSLLGKRFLSLLLDLGREGLRVFFYLLRVFSEAIGVGIIRVFQGIGGRPHKDIFQGLKGISSNRQLLRSLRFALVGQLRARVKVIQSCSIKFSDED